MNSINIQPYKRRLKSYYQDKNKTVIEETVQGKIEQKVLQIEFDIIKITKELDN